MEGDRVQSLLDQIVFNKNWGVNFCIQNRNARE
jgi:hypothetical protein